MSKKLFLILFALPFFFSCKKGDGTSVDSSYTINGIHDVDMTQQNANVLTLMLEQKASSKQQNVTISVENLPAGVSADIQPANGIPSFASVITFYNDFLSPGGKYPIKIVGTSAAGRREYDLNITIPSLNGWALNGKVFKVSDWVMSEQIVYDQDTFAASILCTTGGSNFDNAVIVMFSKNELLPKNEGQQYTFKTADGDYAKNGEVVVGVLEGRNSYVHLTAGQTVSVYYANGKYTLKGGPLKVKNYDNADDIKDLSFTLTQ
jgi:hypothetical protein